MTDPKASISRIPTSFLLNFSAACVEILITFYPTEKTAGYEWSGASVSFA
jgi:hypothetical protein